MVNVNKKYLEEKFRMSIWSGFIDGIKKAKTESEVEKIIKQTFTPSEIILIEKRLAIFSLLKKGLSYREIGRIIDVTPTTIGFVKNGFLKGKKTRLKKHWRHPILDRIDRGEFRKSKPKFPTYTGKGRWRFLDMR